MSAASWPHASCFHYGNYGCWTIMETVYHCRNGCERVCERRDYNHRATFRSSVFAVRPSGWWLWHRIFRVSHTCYVSWWPARGQQAAVAWLGRACYGDRLPRIHDPALRRRSIPRRHSSLQYLPTCHKHFHWDGTQKNVFTYLLPHFLIYLLNSLAFFSYIFTYFYHLGNRDSSVV
jgi:hypothetical protein